MVAEHLNQRSNRRDLVRDRLKTVQVVMDYAGG